MSNRGPDPADVPTGMTFGPDHTPFESLGGEERVRMLVDSFYDRMNEGAEFAVIRQMHPEDLTESRQKLSLTKRSRATERSER